MAHDDQRGHEDGGSAKEPQAWIFQANPNKYRIEDSLLVEHVELWNLNQHANHVCVDDRVFIWICGVDAGIYATGMVISPPVMQADSPVGQQYWHKASDGRRVKARVRVRYDRILLDRPLLKIYLQADPALWDLSILRSPRGTNFAVSADEWQALATWLTNTDEA